METDHVIAMGSTIISEYMANTPQHGQADAVMIEVIVAKEVIAMKNISG